MRQFNVVTFLLLLIISTAGCSDREQVRVERKNLVQGVCASGNVMPVGHYQVTSKVSGIIDDILVSVGQNVEIGTPLIKLEKQVQSSRAVFKQDSTELARYRWLSDDNIGSTHNLDLAELRYQTSQ